MASRELPSERGAEIFSLPPHPKKKEERKTREEQRQLAQTCLSVAHPQLAQHVVRFTVVLSNNQRGIGSHAVVQQGYPKQVVNKGSERRVY